VRRFISYYSRVRIRAGSGGTPWMKVKKELHGRVWAGGSKVKDKGCSQNLK